jgi:hypothetical protein
MENGSIQLQEAPAHVVILATPGSGEVILVQTFS